MTRRLRIIAIALAVLHGVILLAGFFAPYPYDEQHREYSYAPPARIHFVDSEGRFHLRPFVYALQQELPSGEYRDDPARLYPIGFFVSGPRLFGVASPGVCFVFGTDGFGRDVFSRVLYGGRISILCGLIATLVALGLGTTAGMLAGYYGGWVDRLLMRCGELFLALPWLYLLLAVRAVLPLHISTIQAFLLVVGIIGTMGWARPARLIRGVVLTARESGYVLAAKGFGASGAYLMRRHILPMTWSVILTQATILIPQFIRAEVTLSFLGLGIGEPAPSWGNMLAEARQYFAVVSHTWLLAPGLVLVPLLLGYFVLADALAASQSSGPREVR
jgi:peptide/nickel transport system permease protein